MGVYGLYLDFHFSDRSQWSDNVFESTLGVVYSSLLLIRIFQIHAVLLHIFFSFQSAKTASFNNFLEIVKPPEPAPIIHPVEELKLKFVLVRSLDSLPSLILI